MARVAFAALAVLALLSLRVGGSTAPPAYQLMQRFTLQDPTVRCNDGSSPVYYVRNCTANGDRKPGDPDFCKRNTTEGVARIQFFVYFEDNGYCFDAASCAARTAQETSGKDRNVTLFPDGMMLPYPEVNTNFYKQWSVVVPACSSDLFLGSRATRDPATGFYFQGARIATAVIRELQTRRYFEDGVAGPLALADDVVVGGGVGIVAQSRALAALLPTHTRTVTICDGCVVPETLQPLNSSMPCASWRDCPPQEAWLQGLPLWSTAPAVSSVQQLLSPAVLRAAQAPLLVQTPQVSTTLMAQMGAWPADTNKTRRAYVLAAAEKVRVVGAHFNATFFPTCSSAGPALLDHSLYYYTLANCTNGYGFAYPFALTQAIGTTVNHADENGFLKCVPAINGSTLLPCAAAPTSPFLLAK